MTDGPRATRRFGSLLLPALLVVCLGYQAYRYPFQINSALTSPTYSNTPAWLQYGKWALITALALALLLSTVRSVRGTMRRMPPVRLVALGLEAVLLASALLRLAAGAASVEPWILLVIAGTGLLITLAPTVDERAATRIVRIIVGFAVVSVVVELVQVLLFLVADRLPALAYRNSPSVRFGSVLDDPNGFAVLLALLIPTTWIALRTRPNLRLVVVISLLTCLPLTQSWTGVTAAVVALAATYLTARGLRRDLRRATGLVMSALVVLGVAAFFARSTIAELIRLKRGSAEEHAASFEHIAPAPVPSSRASRTVESFSATPLTSHSGVRSAHPGDVAASGAQVPTATWTHSIESGYVNLLVNYGPILLAAYIALGVLATLLLLRGRTRLPLALRVGGASYLICYLLATANLGLDRTFPCNVLYFILCGLTLAASIPRTARRHDRRRSRTRVGVPEDDPADPTLTPHLRTTASHGRPSDDSRTGRPLVLRREGSGRRRRADGRTSTQRGPLLAVPVPIEGGRP